MYWRHFNLTAEPFSLTPDPSFLYLSPVHAEAYAALMMGLRERRGLTTMIGEVGTGKTTLVYSVLSGLGPEIHTAYVSNARLSFDGILRVALRDFGVPCESAHSNELTDALNTFLLDCANKGTTAAMVIDEAQNLAPETFEDLRLLTNFETYTHKLLQIVLVGQPELDTKLRDPALRQVLERVAVRCVVNPLSRREARAYLEHRLAAVNGSLDIFTRPALQMLVARSRGIPRSLNILAHNAMLFAYGEAADRVSRRFVAAAVREKEGRGLVRLWRRSQRVSSIARVDNPKKRLRSSPWTLSAAAICGVVIGLAIAGGDHIFGRLATPAAKATAREQTPVERPQEVATVSTQEIDPLSKAEDVAADAPATSELAEPTTAPAAPESVRQELTNVETDVADDAPTAQDSLVAALEAPKPEAEAAVEPTPVSAANSVEANPTENTPEDATAEPVASEPEPNNVKTVAIAAEVTPTPARATAPAPRGTPTAARSNARPPAARPRPVATAAATRPPARATATAAPQEARTGNQANEAPQERTRVITVPPGSSLSGLLLTVYGQYSSEMINRVKAVNPQVNDPDFIIAGDKLRFPDAAQDQPVQPAGGQQQR